MPLHTLTCRVRLAKVLSSKAVELKLRRSLWPQVTSFETVKYDACVLGFQTFSAVDTGCAKHAQNIPA